ncbi:MAG: GDSL-type esterase/lipase family protein [Chitinophagaceae bacterium]
MKNGIHRSIVFVAVLLLAAIACNAQDSTKYKTTYYGQKVSQFRLIKDVETGEIIFLGDSITDIAEWADLLKNSKVKNRGISGDNTFGVLARLDEVTGRKPAKVFIMIGINDIADNTADSIIVANYRNIIQRLRKESPATKIYIQSILPTNDGFTEFKRHQGKDGHIRFVNDGLKKIGAEYGCLYIDLYSQLQNNEGKLDTKFTNDGLHLTGEGYAAWINLLHTKKLL